ncbi:hypothetical protein D3C78_16840 [compost metagenome]
MTIPLHPNIQQYPSDSFEVNEYVKCILEMYKDLQSTAAQIKDQEVIDLLIFESFDGESEFEYWEYAEELLKIASYNKINQVDHLHKLHADWPMLNKYDKQLIVYRSLKERNVTLTKEQLLKVIKA